MNTVISSSSEANKHTHSDVNNNTRLRDPKSAALHSLEVTECVFVLASNGTPCHSNAADDQLLWTTSISRPKVHFTILLLPLSGLYVMQHITSSEDTMTYAKKVKPHVCSHWISGSHEVSEEDVTTNIHANSFR